MKKIILTEADRNKIISEKEKAILESFAKTFNKIKRLDENEITELSEKANQKALTQSYKNKILKNVPKFNEMVEKAVDGLGHPMEFKIYPTDPNMGEIYPIEINDNKITISSSEFTDTYDLNKFSDYGDSWDAKINYWFFRFYKLLQKGVKSLESGQNYYKFYIIDTQDNNRVLDGQYSREDAESEMRSSYFDEPSAKIVSLKQLMAMGGKPLVIGGSDNENNPSGGIDENQINEMRPPWEEDYDDDDDDDDYEKGEPDDEPKSKDDYDNTDYAREFGGVDW